MSLRTRLIIAFLCLSVLPLSAVTAFWYASAVRAFERAAQRDAYETAREIGRRMEFVTSTVGHRMDRLFEAGDEANPDPTMMEKRIAPMLGDTAMLVDRVEFHSMEGETVPPPPGLPPAPAAGPAPPRPTGTAASRGEGGHPPRPPAPPPVIVLDVPKIMEEARRAARRGAAGGGVDLGPLLDTAIAASVPAAGAGLAALGEAIGREAVKVRAPTLQIDVQGRRVEVPIWKQGKLVGKANATLNLEKTMPSVLTARREHGEIPFAIDQRGALYTPDPRQRGLLESLRVEESAARAAEGAPQRVGDWIVVARREPSGLVFGIARPIAESIREIRRMSLRNLSMGLLVIALACIGIVPISGRMTRHVSELSAGVRQLAGGDFAARVPVRSSDEFGALAAAFNRMAADLEQHQSLVVEQERLRRELELSRLIQNEMLPRAPLKIGAAEIKGVSIPAREVGGDFFNYFALPDGRLALLVGDVSGKGVSAALLMANVQATLRARLPLETDLARLADGLDREVDANTPRGVYVTLFLGIVDIDARRLRYVNAGHNPQFLLRTSGTIEPLTSTGMPIALYSGQGYAEAEVEIGPGDLLFFYTDGLVETEAESGEMFGSDRLQSLLAEQHTEGIDHVLDRVERTISGFRGRAEPFDDATMMALRING
ncbi:MAG TPA: SpoIIE family protein phosphatase [Vicinamibacterales bacterium]|nr:SpoIIE family protein phosphatase [Vicinamibacterales bacterium]